MKHSCKPKRKHSLCVARKRRLSASKQNKRQVTKIRYGIHAKTGYCVCPRCTITMEREYQRYCDRCGQRLGWDEFNRNHVTIIRRLECSPASARSQYSPELTGIH